MRLRCRLTALGRLSLVEYNLIFMLSGPKYKICKRLGSGIFEKCQTHRYAMSESRSSKTRGRGRGGRARSDFGNQLLEKQRARFTYGLSERQFARYAKEASLEKRLAPIEALYRRMESRLDNVVYRLGLASTRRQARQLVSHGHITVNGRKTTIPSCEVKPGQQIGVRVVSLERTYFKNMEIAENLFENIPSWLSFDRKQHIGMVIAMPVLDRAEMPFDLGVAMEFYSR